MFEDTSPRLADLDGDGRPEVIVVETDRKRGAQLAVYGLNEGRLQKLHATDPIGRPLRWLAPVGIADFDGDGRNDVAYVETPHLAKILRIVTLKQGRLTRIGAVNGLTNHRIGDTEILGGIRSCGKLPEIITASGDWTRIYATRFDSGRLVTQSTGLPATSEGFARVLSCG